MATLQGKMVIIHLLVFLTFIATPIFAARKYERRSDLENVKPIYATGWSVPLVVNSQSLPGTPLTLLLLVIGRGNATYYCAEDSNEVIPTLVTEKAELYDVAPLVPFIPTLADLNSFVAGFVNYDYSVVDNSTLQCIGIMQSSTATPQIYDTDKYGQLNVTVLDHIEGLAPGEDLAWTMGNDDNSGWQVYMVETAGGHGPINCEDQPANIDVAFAAELWFYN